MYVCVCSAVTDGQIREAAQAGARTVRELREDLGVAAECGRCVRCAKECLDEVHTAEPPAKASVN